MAVTATTLISRGNRVPDAIAGLPTGVAYIPDALASAVLAGANPVQRLYAITIGTPLSAFFGRTAFLNVSATSALAITAGSALVAYIDDAHATAIAILPVLTGLVMLLAAIALAIIALIQSAGGSKASPNPDGRYPVGTRDFVGQGAANIGAGLFSGMPIGGSVSGTATQAPAPGEIPGNTGTLLQIFGNMPFADAETIEVQLPPVKAVERPVVTLRLRAQEGIGSSFIGLFVWGFLLGGIGAILAVPMINNPRSGHAVL